MFSVVIPLYNKEKSIAKTLQSVLAQTYPDFEIVVVNDGSTDNSLTVAKQIQDPRIRIIDKENGGVSSARNRGIKEARNEWIAFLDGDDLWKENHLDTFYELISRYPENKVFCTSFIRSNLNFPAKEDSSIQVIENYFDEAIKDHFFWTSVVCINSSVFDITGNFDESLSRGEDLDLWIRIGRKFRIVKSRCITGIYNIGAENKITKSKFLYNSSMLSTVHKKVKYFTSISEKKYFVKITFDSTTVFLKRMDFYSFFKTVYRLLVLLLKPIKNEK